MTTYNFDEIIERRGQGSFKWEHYDPDVIPMFVADMDFRAPEPVLKALHARVDHGVFGYDFRPSQALYDVLIERYARLYEWQVEPDHFIFLPNLVNGLFVTTRMLADDDERVVVNTPVYWPFLMAADRASRPLDMVPLAHSRNSHTIHYEIDFDAFEAAITPQTRLFILCNPHNPVGRVFERRELEKLAEICLRHDLVICSDEIHGDLVYPGHQHIPIASLSPEIAARTITLNAPSKTFNIPGLSFSFAIIPDADLRARFQQVYESMGVHTNIMGMTAALAAYQDGQEWLAALLDYLRANRDFVADYTRRHFPSTHVTVPEGTYLSWLDFREAGLPSEPCAYFLEHARVALSGGWESQSCEGFARLNYGCPRAQLEEALDRMNEAITRLG